MATSIELWRSAAGISSDDFSLLATVSDGSFWSYLDTPVTSGHLYIYRARRYDSISDAYSDWSPLLFLVGMYPTQVIPVLYTSTNANANPGLLTKLGIGIEPTGIPGQAVKAGRLLPFISLDPGKSGIKRNRRKTITGLPGSPGTVLGESKYALKLVTEITPESGDELMCTFFGAPVTTAIAVPATPAQPTGAVVGTPGAVTAAYTIVASNAQGDSAASTARSLTTLNAVLSSVNYAQLTWVAIPGATSYKVLKGGAVLGITQALSFQDTGQATTAYVAPSAPTGNQQLWNTNLGSLTATLSAYFGMDQTGKALNRIYGGVRGHKCAIKYNKKGSGALVLDADLDALYEVDGFTTAAVGLDVATMDTLSPFAESYAIVMIGGAIASCESFSVDIDRSLGEKHILNGSAGPVSHYLGDAGHKISATLWWDNDNEKQRFFGVAAQSGTYSPVTNVYYFPIYVVVFNPVNGGGIVNQFAVYGAYCAYEAQGEAIKGKDGIMQDIDITPFIDPGSTATDLQISMVNSRTNGSIVNPGVLITGFNAGAINSYSN